MARSAQVVFFSALLFLLSFVRGDVHCYFPDGTIDDVGTVPCNATAEVSACCDPRDSCTLSGYCLGQSGYSYRSACTDPTWTSGVCPPLCRVDPISQIKYNGHADIYSCGAGTFGPKFCCGHMVNASISCCATNFTYPGTGNAFKPGTDLLLAQLANASAAVSSQASATHATATVTVTASVNATSNGSPDLGVALGAGIGVPLGLLSLGFLSFLFWREKRKDRRPPPSSGSTETMRPLAPPQVHHSNAPWPPPPPKDDVWKPQNEYSAAAAHKIYGGSNVYEVGTSEPHELRG